MRSSSPAQGLRDDTIVTPGALGLLGLLEFDGDHLRAEVFLAGHTEGKRNPARPLRLVHRRPEQAAPSPAL
jgi:hypothetical protein